MWLVGCALLCGAPSAAAQTIAPERLSQMSIEELMNISVTSASRKEQRSADVAGAVFVITREDIRRSGLRTVPELLRLAPGVQVAEINSNKWAVSVRGFNGLRANKLLVLVDGRSVYNRLFSGVFWDEQNLMLDDIDRIEVIRGPGAALWGANAVNGVINIVTQTAGETRGWLARADAGNLGEQAALRYGGRRGDMRYRLYAQVTDRQESVIVPGVSANDGSHSGTGGFRAEWGTAADGLVLDGAFTAGRSRALWFNLDPQTAMQRPFSDTPTDRQGGHLLALWTRKGSSSGDGWRVQSFFDVSNRDEPTGDYFRRTFDLDAQYRAPVGLRHDLVVGAGYRFAIEGLRPKVGIDLTPGESHVTLVTAFVQDEVALAGGRVALTLGTQVQHDSDAGSGVQPTARVLWKVSSKQRLWAAASRALRTPSLQDRGISVTLPPVRQPGVAVPVYQMARGNPDAETEIFKDLEAGYRFEVGSVGAVDVSGFIGQYDKVQVQDVRAPAFTPVPTPRVVIASMFANHLYATTRGIEVAGHWHPWAELSLDGSVSTFHISPELRTPERPVTETSEDASAPSTQWRLGAVYSPMGRASIRASVLRVGELTQLAIPAYTRADVVAQVQVSGRMSVQLIGQNLFDAAHPEFGGQNLLMRATQVRRSVAVSVRWTSR